MKSNKGITLTSLVIYVIAMVLVVTTVSTITSYFYNNIDNMNASTDSATVFTKFNMYFSEEINIKDNYPLAASTDYIVFSKTGNQYTFKNSSIYRNQVKICDNIEDGECKFEMAKTDEDQENNNLVKVYIKTIGALEYTNTYKIQNF